jgi:hypothetical protein
LYALFVRSFCSLCPTRLARHEFQLLQSCTRTRHTRAYLQNRTRIVHCN